MRFSRIELRDLGICWLVLSLCFSIGVFFARSGDPVTMKLMNFLVIALATLIVIGSGFIIHEISHKAVAQHFGCWAEFRKWVPGLVISIATALLSFGTFIFLAPGAVHILAYNNLTKKENGLISLSGPASNLLLAALFLIPYSFRHISGNSAEFIWQINLFGISFISYPYNLPALLGRLGFQMNLWLAAFNLIPYGPLDGAKIMAWNRTVWGLLTAVSWGLIILMMTGLVHII